MALRLDSENEETRPAGSTNSGLIPADEIVGLFKPCGRAHRGEKGGHNKMVVPRIVGGVYRGREGTCNMGRFHAAGSF